MNLGINSGLDSISFIVARLHAHTHLLLFVAIGFLVLLGHFIKNYEQDHDERFESTK